MSVLLDVLGVSVLNLPGRGNSSGKLGKKAAPHLHPRSAGYLLLSFPELRITVYLKNFALTSII